METKKHAEHNADTKSVQKERAKLLSKAQRFVYPVGVTRKKITIISTAIFVLFVALFITVSSVLVYFIHDESRFTYEVSRIVPFPIGKVDNNFVTYEEYLFELRPNVHFLVEKEQVDPQSKDGAKRIQKLRAEALEKVYQNALAENLAKEYNIAVSDEEVEQRISILKTQASDFNNSEKKSADQAKQIQKEDPRFEEILSEFYDWDMQDLERVLRLQIMKSKLPAVVDAKTKQTARELQKQLTTNPKSFGKVAKQKSQDPESAAKGGDLGYLNEQNSVAYPKEFLQTATILADGQVSTVIKTDFGYHILLRTDTNDKNEPKISHILLKFRQPDEILKELLPKANVQKFDSVVE